MTGNLCVLPTLDSVELATSARESLDISREMARQLGKSAVQISHDGFYIDEQGQRVDISADVAFARQGTVSLPPEQAIPDSAEPRYAQTRVQISNESTLVAAKRLAQSGLSPVALNFANGISPGGGFRTGARAQEENLCRSSALYVTLEGDKMYSAHRKRSEPDSTDWCIYSPSVPVFREDDGTMISPPWKLSFLTCAAPYAPDVGQPRSGDLLQTRILRVLNAARYFGHSSLILGAWGCGAFENDPRRTALDFRSALEGPFDGAFSDVVFAITDWSPERRFLRPFHDVFTNQGMP